MARITAKRDEVESGLMSIGQDPRGYELKANGESIGRVFANRTDMWERNYSGWKITLYESDKIEKRQTYSPKGNRDGWPMTDEGLEQAKKVALDLVKKIYG